MSTARPKWQSANAEAVGIVRNRTSGYAGSTKKTELDLDVSGTRIRVSFLGARAADVESIPLERTIHVLGRLSQWGSNGKRVGIDIAGSRHTWALVDGVSPRAGWSITGVFGGTTTSAEMPDALLAVVTVVIPAAERSGRSYPERRQPYEVVARGELAGRLRGIPDGTIVDLAGTLESVPASDGYGRQVWRSTLLMTELRGPGASLPAAAAPVVAAPAPVAVAAPAGNGPQPAAAATQKPQRTALPW